MFIHKIHYISEQSGTKVAGDKHPLRTKISQSCIRASSAETNDRTDAKPSVKIAQAHVFPPHSHTLPPVLARCSSKSFFEFTALGSSLAANEDTAEAALAAPAAALEEGGDGSPLFPASGDDIEVCRWAPATNSHYATSTQRLFDPQATRRMKSKSWKQH